MNFASLPVGIISQTHFDRGAARWASVVASSHHKALRRCLQPTEEQSSRLQLVAFSLEHIVLLLSTVGASYINARFLLLNVEDEDGDDDSARADERFTVALYASDANGVRMSAYFLPEGPEPARLAKKDVAITTPPLGDSNGLGAKQVPFHVVKSWIENWKHVREITQAMFITSYGPLEGYQFNLSDFREALFNAQPLVDGVRYSYAVRVDFGLHHYYPAMLDCQEPAATFGLVLRLQPYELTPEETSNPHRLQFAGLTTSHSPQSAGKSTTQLTVASEEPGEPFYDMSTPCPPGH